MFAPMEKERRSMNLIFLGAPGAGKGTAASKLSLQLNIPHISSGDIFREAMKNRTELGILAEKYISQGCLVPDEVTIGLIEDRLSEPDAQDGFILDGYPRTIVQAIALDAFLKKNGKKINKVINIVVAEDQLVERITNRRVCLTCKASYNLKSHTGLGDVCPECGGQIIQRADDTEEVILNRLKAYHQETEPLIGYYKKCRKLAMISSEEKIEDTFENVLIALRIKGI